mgnify:CR=1 FL=1
MNLFKIFIALIILSNLSGCTIPTRLINAPFPQERLHRKKINKEEIIIKSLQKVINFSEIDARILWENYKHSNSKSLKDYLLTSNPWHLQDQCYIYFLQRLKVQSKMLIRGYLEK